MPLQISVIVPTYNRADLICETLESVLNQSHKPSEVIVVDDGSTDNTETVVRPYGSAVQYLRIENSGECRARNVGVAASSSPWVAFCDSDDLWHRDKLRMQCEVLQSAPGVEYSFTNFKTVVDGAWSATTKFDTSPSGYWDLPKRHIAADLFVVDVPMNERVIVHQPIFPSTVMMTRRFFDSVGKWNEPLGRTPSVDLEFHFRCVSKAGIAVVAAPVVGIRKHASNFSGDTLKTTIGEINVLRYMLANNPVARSCAPAINEQIISRSISAAEGAFAAGNLGQMTELLAAVPHRNRPLRLYAKSLIATLPVSGDWVRKTVLRASSARSHV